MNLRYSEIFFSFQGEAAMTGQPAVWLRLFGCNLNCNGFGQVDPTGETVPYELPYQNFDGKSVSRVEDLPVWTKGCDSSYSWSAKFRHLVHQDTVENIATKLEEQLVHPSNPKGLFRHPITGQDTMLCITGGEPMLQQKAWLAVVAELGNRWNMPRIINIETNATQPLTPELQDVMKITRPHGIKWHFSMSPKLFSVSGERDVVLAHTIHDYAYYAESSVLKFVCNGTERCWAELDTELAKIRDVFQKTARKVPPIWIMPVGATKDEQEEQWVQDLNIEAMKRGYNVANRVQCFVFGNVIGR